MIKSDKGGILGDKGGYWGIKGDFGEVLARVLVRFGEVWRGSGGNRRDKMHRRERPAMARCTWKAVFHPAMARCTAVHLVTVHPYHSEGTVPSRPEGAARFGTCPVGPGSQT